MDRSGVDYIDISAFSSQIGSIISMYSRNVSNETEKWIAKTARECAKELRESPEVPVRFGGSKGYKAGWISEKKDGKWKVWNKNKPGLGHLLEFPHDYFSHGVHKGQSKAYPHIKNAERNALLKTKELIEKLGRIK